MLNESLSQEQNAYLQELSILQKNIQTIREIIISQEKISAPSGVIETINPTQILDEALQMELNNTSEIEVIKHYPESISHVLIDKLKLSQILTHLIHNAKESLQSSHQTHKKLTAIMAVEKTDDKSWLKISIADNGIGISAEHLNKIFAFGFTTKTSSQGVNLHISALSAKQMGGNLNVTSAGKDQGAVFTLTLPTEPANMEDWVEA